MKKIIIVGLGQMGLVYLKNLLTLGYQESEIVGIDIDSAKTKTIKEQFPGITVLNHLGEQINVSPYADDAYEAVFASVFAGEGISTAIVCTNTPSHHRVIADLADNGVKHIFCEKPLGMNIEAANIIRDAIARTGTKVYAAFLINFSPVLADLTELMKNENLILTEGHVVWGKNRFGNNRPTPGDLEDESVHGVGVLHMLAGINQTIQGINVSGRLTFSKYVDEVVQAKAQALDPTFPAADAVNSSSMIIEQVVTDRCECLTFGIHSSYIMGVQRREVGVLLCSADDPRKPVYYAGMEFDIRTADGKISDRLTLTKIENNSVEVTEKACNKIMEETRAFLAVADGQAKDPRSTDFAEALMAVRFSDSVLRSHMNGGDVVEVYNMTDAKPLLKVA
ncbi:MAG: Gfo/Idh/MocA family oxidoreductase [Candidatus Moranbacteria bacterium]|nr:Gfo/Idh/MocA family oxidoreductase [Candidatus Moranbacteria bacterium]